MLPHAFANTITTTVIIIVVKIPEALLDSLFFVLMADLSIFSTNYPS